MGKSFGQIQQSMNIQGCRTAGATTGQTSSLRREAVKLTEEGFRGDDGPQRYT
jgi:hypothetical protein